MLDKFARTASGEKIHRDYNGSMTPCGCRVSSSFELTLEQLRERKNSLCEKCYPSPDWIVFLNEVFEEAGETEFSLELCNHARDLWAEKGKK